MAQNNTSDATMYDNMKASLAAAWGAKLNADYVVALSMTKAARDCARVLCNRFLYENKIRDMGENPVFGTREQNREHLLRLKYLSCVDALFHAIQVHALGHAAKIMAAQASASQNKESAETHIFEAIAYFETYCVHVKKYNSCIQNIEMLLLPALLIANGFNDNTLTWFQRMEFERTHPNIFMPSVTDMREDAKNAYMQRISFTARDIDLNTGVRHPHHTAVCENLHLVSDVFTSSQLAQFRAAPSLRCLESTTDKLILQTVTSCILTRAREAFVATKRHLCLRDYRECKLQAILGLHLFEASAYSNISNMYTTAAVHNTESMYRVKMMLSLNCALELANNSVAMAQIAVDSGNPMIVQEHIETATKHWDHHDTLLITLNDLLLESYRSAVSEIPRNASASERTAEMQDAENSHGQIPSTVRERAMAQTLFEQARYNMRSRGTLQLRSWLRHDMKSGGIFDGMEGVQKLVERGPGF